MIQRPVISFVFRYDSHFFALKNIYEYFLDTEADVFFCGMESQHYGLIANNADENITMFFPNDISSFFNSWDIDYIFCAVGGRDLNDITMAVSRKRTKIISCFPGILLSSQLESFISKVRSDYVLLNCQKDYKIYKAICKILGIPFNGIHFGSPWVKALVNNNIKSNHCLIVDQVQEPYTKSGRVAYSNFLISVIKDNPCKKFTFKSRNYLISPGCKIFDIESYLRKFQLENLSFSEENLNNLLLDVDECITISSSIAINCLVNDINVYLIDGFTEAYRGQTFFSNSGLIVHHKHFSFKRHLAVNKKWLMHHVLYSQSEQLNFLHDMLASKGPVNNRITQIDRSHKLIIVLIILRFLFLFLKRKNWIVLKRVRTVLSRLA